MARVAAASLVGATHVGCLTDERGNEEIGRSPVFPIRHERPAWSTQNRIAFHDNGVACVNSKTGNYRVDPARVGIWVFDIEAPEPELLVPGGDLPAWSPDGDTLAFVVSGHIHRVARTGGPPTRLTWSGENAACAWSPDGQSIAYESTAGNNRGAYEIWLMRADGSSHTNISHNAVEWRSPDWSPDGEWILHVRLVPSVGNEIFSMDRTGNNEVRLTNNSIDDTDPRYSPDGSRITFITQGLGGSGIPKLIIANADGSAARVLSDGPASWPTWSPDGSRIAFVRDDRRSNDPGNGVLWVIDVATGQETQLTHAPRDLCDHLIERAASLRPTSPGGMESSGAPSEHGE